MEYPISQRMKELAGVALVEEEQMAEGINDPYIFKALFTAGGPGSGKSYVANHVVKGLGLKYVNSDVVFEKFLKKAGLSLKIGVPGSDEYAKQFAVRGSAKEKTSAREEGWINGMLGLLVDGTGKDFAKISKHVKALKANGYDVAMVFVNTSLEVALARNARRARSVDEGLVKEMWQQVQNNMGKFQRLFGAENYFLVDNNDIKEGSVEAAFALELRRTGLKWLAKPVKNPVGKEAISTLMDTGGKTLSDIGEAQELAMRKYSGFVRNYSTAALAVDTEIKEHKVEHPISERMRELAGLPLNEEATEGSEMAEAISFGDMKRGEVRPGGKSGTHEPGASKYGLKENDLVGWFANKYNMANGWSLYVPNSHDKKEFGHDCFRTYTSGTDSMSVVKINAAKGTVAFIDDKAYADEGKVKFQGASVYNRLMVENTPKAFKAFGIF